MRFIAFYQLASICGGNRSSCVCFVHKIATPPDARVMFYANSHAALLVGSGTILTQYGNEHGQGTEVFDMLLTSNA